MTDYVVAIPTFKRYNEIIKKTLPTLQRGKVPKGKIHVFVANKAEEKLYRDKMDPNTYGKIVVGKKGITNQRIFISKYFPVGTNIVSLDDDVEKMQKLKGASFRINKKKKTIKKQKSDNKLVDLKDLDKFFKDAFSLLKKEGLNLWGVYPVNNPFFMDNKVTTDLRFIIGVVHGYINHHDNSLYPSKTLKGKEDYHQSILFYLKDKGILRFNNVSFKTVFLAPGGLGKDRFDMYKKAQEFLVKKYPKIAKPKFRPDGTPEIRLVANPEL